MCNIARNTYYDFYRAKQRKLEVSLDSLLAEQKEHGGSFELFNCKTEDHPRSKDQDSSYYLNEIDQKLKTLDPIHREPLMMFAKEGLGYSQIAERLDCPVGTVMSRIFYARKKAQKMLKPLDLMHDVIRCPQWCSELQERWQNQIPISDKMGIRITQFNGYRFEVSARLNANLNPNASMFAGSIFSMATFAGWGMVWLLLKERQLSASIMLADSHIRFRKPITQKPKAVVSLDGLSGDLDRLASDRKARVKLEVMLFSDEENVGTFVGTFLLVPESTKTLL